MKKLYREFIIREYALDYMCKIFGFNFDMPRGLTSIGIALMLISISLTFDVRTESFTLYDILLTLLLGVMLFFTVIYFRIFPIKPCELKDVEQIYQYESAVKRGIVLPEVESEECLKKIFDANTHIKENVENKKFYKAYRILYHPVVTLLLGGVITILYYYTKSNL